MDIVAHRGNRLRENTIRGCLEVWEKGEVRVCEVDVIFHEGDYYLGHDEPTQGESLLGLLQVIKGGNALVVDVKVLEEEQQDNRRLIHRMTMVMNKYCEIWGAKIELVMSFNLFFMKVFSQINNDDEWLNAALLCTGDDLLLLRHETLKEWEEGMIYAENIPELFSANNTIICPEHVKSRIIGLWGGDDDDDGDYFPLFSPHGGSPQEEQLKKHLPNLRYLNKDFVLL